MSVGGLSDLSMQLALNGVVPSQLHSDEVAPLGRRRRERLWNCRDFLGRGAPRSFGDCVTKGRHTRLLTARKFFPHLKNTFLLSPPREGIT
jgi:hypothetical protein